jgi:hypothetical protein
MTTMSFIRQIKRKGRVYLAEVENKWVEGIVSKRNVKDIKDLHWDTLCGVPLNNALKKFWRPWANPQRLMQFPNRVRVGSTIFLRGIGSCAVDIWRIPLTIKRKNTPLLHLIVRRSSKNVPNRGAEPAL